MKTVSLIDTSTFESHMDGLVGMMAIMAMAQRDDVYNRAWQNIVDLVDTRKELTPEGKQELLDEAGAKLKDRVDGFVASRKAKGYFK